MDDGQRERLTRGDRQGVLCMGCRGMGDEQGVSSYEGKVIIGLRVPSNNWGRGMGKRQSVKFGSAGMMDE